MVLRGPEMALPETVFSNNYKFQEISSWINCSLSVVDLSVETFDIPVNSSLRPGGPGVPFTLKVKVRNRSIHNIKIILCCEVFFAIIVIICIYYLYTLYIYKT